MSRATRPIACDRPFEFECDVVKAIERDGKRYLQGIASGVLEDADGERVTKRAIVDMARQAVQGLKLVAGSHVQDWHNEFGEVTKLAHLPETDELHVEAELEPGHPFADLAWKRAQKGEPLAFSIGGKLKSFFYELVDNGRRRRKALDKIALKHMTVTKRPSYQLSFAQAVAKMAPLDLPPDDDAFTVDFEDDAVGKLVVVRDDVDVEKDKSSVSQDTDSGGSAGDKGKGERNLDVEDAGADNTTATADLPKAGRRLACPNCGHEFGADMPENKEPEGDTSGDNDQEARKRASAEEDDMGIENSLSKLRDLATDDEEQVAKTDEPAAEADDTGKTDTGEQPDVTKTLERMIAAAHSEAEDQIAEVRKTLADGFELVAKSHQRIMDVIQSMPQGKKSIARVRAQGTGTPTRAETEADVGKTIASHEPTIDGVPDDVAKAVHETDDPLRAMKLINHGAHGVKSTGVG